jgi:hypothetical protein
LSPEPILINGKKQFIVRSSILSPSQRIANRLNALAQTESRKRPDRIPRQVNREPAIDRYAAPFEQSVGHTMAPQNTGERKPGNATADDHDGLFS